MGIDRKTKEVNTLGIVKYFIYTCQISDKNSECKKLTTYLATLNVESNPQVGPRIVTVKSIKKIKPKD